MEFIIDHPDALQEIVPTLFEFAGNHNIWVLTGEIGAGKTTLTKAICQYLKVEQKVVSPTFSIVNEYEYSSNEGSSKAFIYHMDLYRLKNLEEALDIGIEEYLDSQQLCIIEWPEIIELLLPNTFIRIHLEIVSESSRKILFLKVE